jgi:molybdopterin-guanine dinucleotide biosynthesis protein B
MSEVNLKVNDEKVPLNDFMEVMLKNLLLGYLNALKGIPEEINSISVKIDL